MACYRHVTTMSQWEPALGLLLTLGKRCSLRPRAAELTDGRRELPAIVMVPYGDYLLGSEDNTEDSRAQRWRQIVLWPDCWSPGTSWVRSPNTPDFITWA